MVWLFLLEACGRWGLLPGNIGADSGLGGDSVGSIGGSGDAPMTGSPDSISKDITTTPWAGSGGLASDSRSSAGGEIASGGNVNAGSSIHTGGMVGAGGSAGAGGSRSSGGVTGNGGNFGGSSGRGGTNGMGGSGNIGGDCGVICSANPPSTAKCQAGRCLVTLATGMSRPFRIAVDGTAVYWTNNYNGTVMKVPLDGGDAHNACFRSGQPRRYCSRRHERLLGH